jgi:membrane protease YdiL (CAAX protease family)
MEGQPAAPSLVLSVLVWLGLWGGVSVWYVIAARLWRGEPVLPVEPRRPVPWTGLDLAGILLFHTLALVAVGGMAVAVLGRAACDPLARGGTDRSHQIEQLFSGAAWPVMLACTITAVVIAPVVEEIFFRLLLQGWLEGVDRRLRPAMPTLGRWIRWGTLPVLLVAILFAMLHFRIEGPRYHREFLLFMMLGQGAARILTAAFAVILVVVVRGAKAADLGWRLEKLPTDIGLGLAGFFAVAVPIYAIQIYLTGKLPSYLAPDPITLLFFAAMLGVLYLRTHRILPSMVAHMALNGTTMLFLWARVAG